MTGQDTSDAINETRFASNNEIYYNIASILKYVPFCRHIYIVTDQQQPQWIDEFARQGLCDTQKIRIVDHTEIFTGYEQYLPTFNTRSIESMLWNIRGLSDYFIYLNDDFFFNSVAKIEDFLQHNQLVVYGHWQSNLLLKIKLKYRQFLHAKFAKPVQPKHMIAQMLSADILGMNQFFEIHHYPHIVDRKILRDYLLAHPQRLETQLKFKFRNVAQINPITLMNHLKVQKQQAILKPDLPLAYLKNEQTLDNFIIAIQNQDIKYGCIQSLDQFSQPAADQVLNAMSEKFTDFLPASLHIAN